MSMDFHWSDIPPGTSPEMIAWINAQRGIFENSTQRPGGLGSQFGRTLRGGAPILAGAASGGIPGFLLGAYRAYQNMPNQGNSIVPGLGVFGGSGLGSLSSLLPLLLAGGALGNQQPQTHPSIAPMPDPFSGQNQFTQNPFSSDAIGGISPIGPLLQTSLQRVPYA